MIKENLYKWEWNLLVNFDVLEGCWLKLKESKERDKYINLAINKSIQLWNMKMTILPNIYEVLGTTIKRSTTN